MSNVATIDIEVKHRQAVQRMNEITQAIEGAAGALRVINVEAEKFKPQKWRTTDMPAEGSRGERAMIDRLRESLKTQEQMALESHKRRVAQLRELYRRQAIEPAELISGFKKSQDQYLRESGRDTAAKARSAELERAAADHLNRQKAIQEKLDAFRESIRTKEQRARDEHKARIAEARRLYREGQISYDERLTAFDQSRNLYNRDSGRAAEAKAKFAELERAANDDLNRQKAIQAKVDAFRESIRTKEQRARDEHKARIAEARRLYREGQISYDERLTAFDQSRNQYNRDSGRAAEAKAKFAELERAAIDDLNRQKAIQAKVDEFRESIRTKEQRARDEHKARIAEARRMYREGQIGYDERLTAFQQSNERYRKDSGKTAAEAEQLARQEEAAMLRKRLDLGLTERQFAAQERFNKKKAEYNALLQNGALNEKQHAAAMKEAKQELDGQANSLDGMKGKLLGLVSGWVSVSKAIDLAKQAYDNMDQRQQAARLSQMDMGAAFREAFKNVEDGTTEGELQKNLFAMAKAAGVGQLMATQTYAGMASAKGSASEEDLTDAMILAMKINPSDPNAAANVGGAMLQEKTRTPGRSIKEIAGLYQAAKAKGIENDENFHQYVAPVLSQTSAPGRGNTWQEMAALRAVMGSHMGDRDARISTNAFLHFVTQLESEMPDVKGGTFKKLKELSTNPKFSQRRHKLLGAFDEKFNANRGRLKTETDQVEREKIDGEMKALFTIMSMIKNEPGIMKDIQLTLDAMPKTKGEAENRMDFWLSERDKNQFVKAETIARGNAATLERIKNRNIGDAVAGEQRNNLGELMTGSGAYPWETTAAQYYSDFQSVVRGKPAAEAAGQQLRQRAADIRNNESMTSRFLTSNAMSFMADPTGIQRFVLKSMFRQKPSETQLSTAAELEENAALNISETNTLLGRILQTLKEGLSNPVEVNVETKIPAKANVKPPEKRPSAGLQKK